MSGPPPIIGIHEAVLYGRDIAAAERFYSGILGLRAVSRSDRGISFRVNESSMLLFFDPVRAAAEARTQNVPAHGAEGPGHVAFNVPFGSLAEWRTILAHAGVGVELERAWDLGGRSLYFRDPAENSVELIEGTVWPD